MPNNVPGENDSESLKQKVEALEIQVKHLKNELKLAESEKENARQKYFDIIKNTEDKAAERTKEILELRKITDAKSKELQIMLDRSPAMIFYKDAQQKYIRVNKAFSGCLGIPIQKIVGKTYKELFPECSNQLLQDDLDVLQSGEPLLNVSANVESAKGKMQVLINKIPYKDINGKIIGIIGFALDVSELRRAERDKRELEIKLGQMEKMEAIARLAGGVAHDLNNVLSAVVSYPDLLLMKLPADSPFRRPILTMQKSGQKAAAIVEDLLTLARRGVPITEVVNLNDIINNYLASPEYDTLKKYNSKVTITTQLEPDLLNIKGSPIHLSQTVMNLVSNAAEATSHRGSVSISTINTYVDKPLKGYTFDVPRGEYIVLKVADNGTGISPEDLKRIFEPFYTKKVMGRSGTGLGMAVVWGTVKDHKGNLRVMTAKGKGTTFELYFPVTREPRTRGKINVPIKEYIGSGEHILLVDDVADQLDIASTLLRSLNYSVNTCVSGEEAVEYLKNHTADLVILDMIMDPGIDGLDTYRNILDIHPHQKAIITSGYSETERVRDALKLGVGQYIKKPYTLEKIGLAIREEFERKQWRKQDHD